MRAMRVVTKLERDARGASLVEYALIIAMVALVAVLAMPMLGVGVKKTSCDAIRGLDEQMTWWDAGQCYTETGTGESEVLF